MDDALEALLRAAGIPDPDRAEGLWAEYRSGGPGADAAFRTLLAWYGLPVYRRVWGFVRSDAAAEDVFQDVLARLHARRCRLLTWGHARRWLRAAADGAAVNHHHREAGRRRREARAARPDTAPGDGPERADAQTELRDALARLPARDREVLTLLFFEGLSAVETGRALGKDRDTVAAWRARALDRLRRLLPAGGVLAGGSATVEGVLAAGRPVLTAARLGDLAGQALTGAVRSGPTLGKVAVVLLAGLTLGGVGLGRVDESTGTV